LQDIMMPRMNGFEVLDRMKEHDAWKHIPVIVISAVDDQGSAVRCIEIGADDYLTKPVNVVLLKARVRSCLERKGWRDQEQKYRQQMEYYAEHLEERVQEQLDDIYEAQLATIFSLAKLAESRDPETGEHLDRMREYCRVLAQQLATTELYGSVIDEVYINLIFHASPLHDIGKVAVPDDILKKPGKLEGDEWLIMQQHAAWGGSTLRDIHQQYPGNTLISMGIDIAESHHEKWDGSGYPLGSSGQEIPLAARILALGDVYDALTSKRCYKKAFSHEKSRQIILENSGTHFDPDVVEAFLVVEDQFVSIRERLQDKQQEK